MASLKYHIEDRDVLKGMLFNNFLKIRSMTDVPDGIRVKLLSNLFSANPDSWKVVGITHKALVVFKEHKFERVSRMGINRSHIIQRANQYKEMLFNDETFERKYFDVDKFWNSYIEGDKTILATSKENMSSKNSTIYQIDPSLGLFKTRGYAWKHGDQEIKYLKLLWKTKNF